MLRRSLLGESQRRIAEAEGVTPSAVSQQFARGIAAVRQAQGLLEGES
jgi:predicted transcriptional regulator